MIGILSETGFTSGFSGFKFDVYTTSTGSEASISSDNDALHFSHPSSLLQVHSFGRLYVGSVATGISTRRRASISSYMRELFSRFGTPSIAITRTAAPL